MPFPAPGALTEPIAPETAQSANTDARQTDLAETPLGEKFSAKFDGKDYPVEDDPGGTTVSAKRLSPDEVELTSKRNGKVVAIKHMTVAPGGKSIRVIFKNEEGETVSTFDLKKQP